MTINGFPAMSWQDFLNIPDGETVFNFGASECVALANLYATSVLGCDLTTVQIGSAEQWWTTDAILDAWGFDRITSNPQVGDIFIGSYGLYNSQFGHIGVVVRAWDGSTFGTMEQNVGREVVSRHDRTMQNIDGFLRTRNQAAIGGSQPAATLAGDQRQAGPLGVFRRAEPNQQSEHLDGDLEAGSVGNFVGWIHGEDRGGNDVWFQGVSGNWFWSGAFTDAGTHDLADLNAPNAPAVAPAPAPARVVEPVAVVEPSPVVAPIEPAPVVEPAAVVADPAPAVDSVPAVDATPAVSEIPVPEKPKPVLAPIADTTAAFTNIQNQGEIKVKTGIFQTLTNLGFYNDALTRAVNTFAQVALAAVGTGAVGITNIDYTGIANLALGGAVISLVNSLVRATTPTN
jgi:hypothetical protein